MMSWLPGVSRTMALQWSLRVPRGATPARERRSAGARASCSAERPYKSPKLNMSPPFRIPW